VGNTLVYEDPSVLTNRSMRRLRVCRTQQLSYIDESGRVRKRSKSVRAPNGPSLSAIITRLHRLPTFEANQKRLGRTRGHGLIKPERCEEAPHCCKHSRLRGCGGVEGALQGSLLHARLSLRRQDHRQRPRRVLPERRRVSNRCGGCSRVPRRARTRRTRSLGQGREHSKRITRPPWSSSAEMSSVRATARSAPNAVNRAVDPDNAWSRAVSNGVGECSARAEAAEANSRVVNTTRPVILTPGKIARGRCPRQRS